MITNVSQKDLEQTKTEILNKVKDTLNNINLSQLNDIVVKNQALEKQIKMLTDKIEQNELTQIQKNQELAADLANKSANNDLQKLQSQISEDIKVEAKKYFDEYFRSIEQEKAAQAVIDNQVKEDLASVNEKLQASQLVIEGFKKTTELSITTLNNKIIGNESN